MARLMVEALQEQGIACAILPGDSVDPRILPAVTVKVVKGQPDPPHTSNFIWRMTISVRARDVTSLAEVSSIVESISTEHVYDAVTRHDEFRVFCVTNEGGSPVDADHTRSYSVDFSLWATDLRQSSAA